MCRNFSAFLCSCNSAPAETDGQVREISSYSKLCSGGELYLDYDKETFYDFTSMKGTYICAKPNCNHSDPKVCSAYGMSQLPFIYNNNIYYFVSDVIVHDDGSFSDKTDLYMADMDGTNREIIDTIEDLSIDCIKMFLVGDELYLSATKHSFSQYGGYGSDQTMQKIFCKYNLSDNSLHQIKNFGEKYSCGIDIVQVQNFAESSKSYISLPEDELIGEEIK